MKIFQFIGSSIFQILSTIFVLGYLLGVLNIYFSDKNEYCVMTYMFEYPQFVKVTLPESEIYPQYGLYAYSEGRFTERARKMWFDGIPVLYLPGNSGSHMQARSLASVALRKALTGPYEYHFDYFTIAYNEELSGLYGGVLESQTKFASLCISKILSLYKSNKYTKTTPTKVILIGHSMGGAIAKRLLAYPSTINSTLVAITLAAPLEAPIVNVDPTMNDFYTLMEAEWKELNKTSSIMTKKILLSFGNGPRDILMPSGLTSSKDSFISGLTTAIPGVWVSPDHVSIVWCKQLVMAINRYLFDIVDPQNEQITENRKVLMAKALQYFQANRTMTLNPQITRPNVTMIADAFWYEDNRRIYQISRPDIEKTTYLMIRLVNFPQNRFVAIESVNLTDRDWIFGCNAKFTYNTYRYCKQATLLTELSRWTGAVQGFGKRKLATIHLHHIKELEPEWTHVIVKVSPTRKPIVLNVDINDLASRQITVPLPSVLSFGSTTIKAETEPNSFYYELSLPGFETVDQAYLLYVEPTAGCKASQYQVSAEVHVPWAKNNEYYHYYTHLKISPLKLRLYKSNPNVTLGLEATEFVKVTLLLDPQCTYSISISSSWYQRLAQLARHYSTLLTPYMAAVMLLAVRSNILHLKEFGKCKSLHGAFISDGVKPYYALVCARMGFMMIMSVPLLTYIFENSSWRNLELMQFCRSLLLIPAYMTALGLLHIIAAAILGVLVFSSQLAHRLLFRIMWRGGPSMAEKVATGLQKMPILVNVALISGVPLSCGAASLVAGAAFYAFILSKMYEEYLEDYVYKLMARVAAKMCRLFTKKKRSESETSLVKTEDSDEQPTSDLKAIENTIEEKEAPKDMTKTEEKDIRKEEIKEIVPKEENVVTNTNESTNCKNKKRRKSEDTDDDLNNLNFHMMMFFMWTCVTLINVPALLTWARNFKYNMVLKPDTSYNVGLVMSICSTCLWQMSGPKKNLKHYDAVAALLFAMAVCILVLGPFSLTAVNYIVTFTFVIITLQQLCDKEIDNQVETSEDQQPEDDLNKESSNSKPKNEKSENVSNKPSEAGDTKENESAKPTLEDPDQTNNMQRQDSETSDCACNENRIYSVFKNLREKFEFSVDD